MLSGYQHNDFCPSIWPALNCSSSSSLSCDLFAVRRQCMYWLFHDRIYVVLDGWKIIHKQGAKIVLVQLFYYGQNYAECWGEEMPEKRIFRGSPPDSAWNDGGTSAFAGIPLSNRQESSSSCLIISKNCQKINKNYQGQRKEKNCRLKWSLIVHAI